MGNYSTNNINNSASQLIKSINTVIDDKLKNLDSNIKQINISEELSLKDYYKTDIHWINSNLEKVTNKIKSVMGL